MKQNKKSPTKKETMEMILALEQRVLTLQMFMDAMSNEFYNYLLYKDDVEGFKAFKEQFNEGKKND
tara:strand:- start:2148 stop:2345 length:198 start_codon:yes stop_codon:yes gene_type:complete